MKILCVKKDYDLENLVKDWGFIKLYASDYCMYLKESENGCSCIRIFNDRDVLIHHNNRESAHINDEILCLLYDLIQAGIIIKE